MYVYIYRNIHIYFFLDMAVSACEDFGAGSARPGAPMARSARCGPSGPQWKVMTTGQFSLLSAAGHEQPLPLGQRSKRSSKFWLGFQHSSLAALAALAALTFDMFQWCCHVPKVHTRKYAGITKQVWLK
jgi:hypothetical protein